MTDLVHEVIDAHGGLDRWAKASTLSVNLAVGGPFWGLHGFADDFLVEHLELDVQQQRSAITPWLSPDNHLIFTPDLMTLQNGDGGLLESLEHPRTTYGGYVVTSVWTSLQVGYVLSYAMWNYLTTPLLFVRPGVRAREIEPWEEDGETWRRLRVQFPESLATHGPEQTFYYGPDALLRRHDYIVDVNAGARVAHYTQQHRTFDGLVFPTRRRVYRRNAQDVADMSLAAITLDIDHIDVR